MVPVPIRRREIEDKIHFHKSPDYNAVVNNVV